MARFEILDEQPKGRFEILDEQKPESGIGSSIAQGAGNLLAGAVRGAGSIGATLLAPIDAAARKMNGGNPVNMRVPFTDIEVPILGNERRQAMDEGLKTMGADPNSLLYKGGKLGAEVAGTSGIGGAAAGLVRAGLRAAPSLAPVINPLAAAVETGGFRAGGLSGAPGAMARIVGGAINGGLSAGLVNPEDAKAGALIGGALPVAAQTAGMIGSSIRNAIAPNVTPEVRQLAQRAQELGINVPADRITNSRPLNAVAASLNYVPLSGRSATENGMVSQLNTALSKTFGQNDSNVTMALRKADNALGSQFDDFLRNNSVQMTPKFQSSLDDAAMQASNELAGDQAGIIMKQIQNIRDKAAEGSIDGQAAYNIKKTLDRIGNRNSPEAWYALDLKGKLMDALNDSVGGDKAAAFANLRQQYGNMLSLQKLAKNGAEGEISAARLANLQNIRNSDVQELADIAAQFVKGREGSHGAAQRVFGGLGIPGAAALGALGVPGAAATAIGGAGMMGAGRGLNSLLNSQTAKNFVLNSAPMLGESQAPGLLTQGAYRALPLLPAQ